jgi:hypothetical protein
MLCFDSEALFNLEECWYWVNDIEDRDIGSSLSKPFSESETTSSSASSYECSATFE